MSEGARRQRSGRLRTQFGVRIRGVDSEIHVRRGDVSLTGVYFELDPAREVGALGSVQALHIKPLDGGEHIEVMARIVRIRGEQRLYGAPLLNGIAFEFLPENDQRLALLEGMIRRCVDAHAKQSRDVQVELHRPMENTTDHATIETLGLQQMSLRSRLPIPIGHSVSAQVVAPRSRQRIEVTGTVSEVSRRNDGEFEVQVDLSEDVDEAILVELIDELIVPNGASPPSPNRHEHLQGSLERVKITSLINLFAMDRVSGILTVHGEGWQGGKLYFRDGSIVDAVGPGKDPVEIVHTMTHLQTGEFTFEQSTVLREDRLNMGTTALMLELARLDDEAAQGEALVEAAVRAAPLRLVVD